MLTGNMFPNILTDNRYRCTFDSKGLFTTNLELAFARDKIHSSKAHVQVHPPRDSPKKENWMKQPPDFSYKLYISPCRPSKKAKVLKKKKKTMTKSTVYEELYRIRSNMLLQVIQQEPPPKIITAFPRVGPYEAQLMFVKEKIQSSKYQDPKPHDYRGYETNIPDFVTSYPRDPLNLKFKSQCLSKIHGLHPLKEEKKGMCQGRFITHKPQELKWDPKLVLQKEPWPPKPVTFTRHKGPRDARNAFIERVEETLSKLWQEEKQAESKRKSISVNVSQSSCSKTDSEMKLRRIQQEGRSQKAQLPKSSSTKSNGWDIAEQKQLALHLKPQPLGFLVPGRIVQSVEELRYK